MSGIRQQLKVIFAIYFTRFAKMFPLWTLAQQISNLPVNFFFPPSFSCRTHHFSWVKINVINLFHSNWHWKRTHSNPSNVWTERERECLCVKYKMQPTVLSFNWFICDFSDWIHFGIVFLFLFLIYVRMWHKSMRDL